MGRYVRVRSAVSACGRWRSYTVTIEGEAVIPAVVHDLGNGRYKVTYIPYSPGRTLPGEDAPKGTMLEAAYTVRCAVAATPSRGAEDGRGESSPGADVAAIPVQMWAGVHSGFHD